MNILVLDDHEDLCYAMERILSISGHTPHVFQRALDLLISPKVETADVVMADYYVPDMNGVEVIRRLRERKPDLPALLVTGSREQQIVRVAGKLSDCKILYKPLAVETLLAELKRLDHRINSRTSGRKARYRADL